MKKLSTTLAAALQSLCMIAATVPVEWTETPRDRSPRQFTARHGETLRIRCTLAGFDGAIEGEPRLYFQTNGMGRLWWDAPATASSNSIEAVFGASEDVGADRVSLYLGSPSNAYASAVLRLLPSPGFTPASLSPPVLSLDFAALAWSNAPWATTNALAVATNAVLTATERFVTNKIAEAAEAATNYTDAATETSFRVDREREGDWHYGALWNGGIYETYLGFLDLGSFVHYWLPPNTNGVEVGDNVWDVHLASTRYVDGTADAVLTSLAPAIAAKQDALPYPTNAIPYAAIADAPAPADYSTNNATLVATIEATAPAPGNYATVSNRAVNARGRLDLAVYGQEDAYIVEFFDLDDEFQSFPTLLGKMTRIDDFFYRIDGVEGYLFADDGFEMTFVVAGGDYAQWSPSRPLPDDLVLECTIGRRRYVISRPPTSPTGDTLAKASELATAVSNVVDKPYVESLGIESGVQSLEPATNYTDEAIGVFARTNTLYATTSALAAVSNAAASASLNADTALRLVMGENVWFLVTNYMRTVEGVLPSLELWEVRDGETNLVYSSKEEITNLVQDVIHDCRTNLEATVAAATNEMPSKAWGRYQSSGADNPQPGEVLLVNEPTVIMTGGGEWNRYIETGGSSVWVLQSNGHVSFGGDTNGNFFAVKDDEGGTHIKVARTDSYEVDALPIGTGWSGGDFVVTYNSNIQPVLYATTNLTEAFEAEFGGRIDSLGMDVSWTQSGTNYVATIQQDARHPALFVHAKVTQEGGVAIINSAPTRFDGGIQIGNQKYSIGTYNDGTRTFLTLEATP